MNHFGSKLCEWFRDLSVVIKVNLSIILGIFLGFLLSRSLVIRSLFEKPFTTNFQRLVLTTIASASVVILAFFLPYIMDLVSNLSETYYGSETVTKPFFERWDARNLHKCFAGILIVSILLVATKPDSATKFWDLNPNIFWRAFFYWVLVVFTWALWKLIRFYEFTKNLVKTRTNLLEKLFEGAEKKLE